MKGTLHKCLEKMILEHYGSSTWSKILKNLNLPTNYSFNIQEDIQEDIWEKLLNNTAAVLNKSYDSVQDEYSDYWVNTYTAHTYAPFYLGAKSTRDVIERLDYIHLSMTKHIPNAKPPRFRYKWLSHNVLVIDYQSKRNMLSLFKSYIKGLDQRFDCKTEVKEITLSKLEIHFN